MNFTKDPAAVLDYKVDWTPWLAAGETITASQITVSDGLTKDSETHDDHTVTVWLSGGTDNTGYAIDCHITTSQGRQDERSFGIVVRER